MTLIIIILAEELVNALCGLRELREGVIPHNLRLCLLYYLASPRWMHSSLWL